MIVVALVIYIDHYMDKAIKAEL
jgi:hypothetical protein